MSKKLSILGIAGSLRKSSSSNFVLHHVISLFPDHINFSVFDGIDKLPHFDDPNSLPPVVADFRARVRVADGVLICTPEYAVGIHGSLKNALDWTVASGDFVDKPVALITASSQGEKGHAALLLVLQAISAKVPDDAHLIISFIRTKISNGEVSDDATRKSLKHVVDSLVKSVEQQKINGD